VVYSRRLDRPFYLSTIGVLLALRYLFVRASCSVARPGSSRHSGFIWSAPAGSRDFIGALRALESRRSMSSVHFLAPGEPGATASARRQAVETALDEAMHSARSIEPTRSIC